MRKKMSPLICGYLLVLVAQYAVNTAPVGAPETIELFHPEMPPAPARSPANKKEAVPVIHLDTDENGKATVDAYLKMFPQDLLTSNKKVRPIEVRKIEHEDFIDYEIEFVELSEEIDEGEEQTVNLILSDNGEPFNHTNEDMLSSSYVNDSGSDEQSSINSSSSSSELSEESQKMNLVTFVDLLRRARIRHQSKILSDKRRRRRIKLRRDPVRNIPTDTNDSSNHIDTAHDLKREQNRYSKTDPSSKPRELIRNKSPTETNRNSGNRRITLPRHNIFRERKRIPIKSGRKFSRDDSPIDQLIKLRNPQIIAKTERSTTEKIQKMTSTSTSTTASASTSKSTSTSTSTSADNLYKHSTSTSTSTFISASTSTSTSASTSTSTSTSADNLYTNSINEEDTDESIVVTRNVTSTRFVTPASSFPILTSTTAFLEQTTENNLDDKLASNKYKLYPDMATTREQFSSKTTIRMVNSELTTTATTTTSTTTTSTTLASSTPISRQISRVTISNIQSKTAMSNDRQKTTSIKPIPITTGTSMTSTTLMMYPEVFTDQNESKEVTQKFEESIPIETISLPFSLFSLFGGRPKSSRLQIAPAFTSPYRLTTTSSKREEEGLVDGGKAINSFRSKNTFLDIQRKSFTSINQIPQVTTVTSSSQFSIISTSTQTSIPLHEPTTTPKTEDEQLTNRDNPSPLELYLLKMVTGKTNTCDECQSNTEHEPTTTAKSGDEQLLMEKNDSSSIEPYLAEMETAETNAGDGRQSSADGSFISNKKFSTTISLANSLPTTETNPSDLSRTTTLPNWMQNSPMTEMKNEDTTNTNNMQNEYKYQEVMTSTKIEPITDDSRLVSTPNNTTAALPEDLLLSESITSVYLHNDPMTYTITNNVGTTENPRTEAVNSITLMPYSKLANHRQETGKESTTAQSITENIFIVTPNTKKTTSTMQETTTNGENQIGQIETFHPTTQITDIPLETLFSGQYHEINPGQYHEVSPGQYREHNPGQYEEIHPGQYEELHPGQPGQYHNFEKSYSGDYEVNDVKVDFDHQDEHKIYNVQAKAGDFIIGEVGRIDVNNGQTLEGVRYTALEGEVDPLRISQILEKFFGTRTS